MTTLIFISISTGKRAEDEVKTDCKNRPLFHYLWNKAMSFKSLPVLHMEGKKIW